MSGYSNVIAFGRPLDSEAIVGSRLGKDFRAAVLAIDAARAAVAALRASIDVAAGDACVEQRIAHDANIRTVQIGADLAGARISLDRSSALLREDLVLRTPVANLP